MARRPSNKIKITKKQPRKTQSEQYIINRKYMGDEPVYTDTELTMTQYTKALQWYNIFCDVKEAKEYMVEYLKNTNQLNDLKKFKSVPDKWINMTTCWIARMVSRGANLPDSASDFFKSRFDEMVSRDYRKVGFNTSSSSEEETKPVVKVSIQDRMAVQLDAWICDIELEIDNFTTEWKPGFKMYEWLQANQVPAVQAKRMHDYYNPLLLEMEETMETEAEYWKGYSKKHLTMVYGFYVMIVEDLEQYTSNEKKVRKPRTQKPVSAEKKLKDFKHQNFDNDLKIQSVQPIRVLGAQELWVFSTKYNQLTVFRADDPKGLDVHRTAITGFSESQSQTKKLRAKDVPSVLKSVLEGGKVSLRKVMTEARGSEQKLQVRMNENTLLLRVISK